MSRPHGIVSSPRCLIVIIKLFSFQGPKIGLLSFLFIILSTNDYATYHSVTCLRRAPYRMPVVVYPINPSSTRVHNLFGLVEVHGCGNWIWTSDFWLMRTARWPLLYTAISLNFMYILYLKFRKISNFQAYLISNWYLILTNHPEDIASLPPQLRKLECKTRSLTGAY